MDEFQIDVIQRLSTIEAKLSNGITKKQDDHEKRLRFLERGLYIAVGVFTVIQIILNLIMK